MVGSSEDASSPRIPSWKASKPSIVLTTLPKSASVYISRLLGGGLGYDVRNISIASGDISGDTIDVEALQDLAAGGIISQEHFGAHPRNLENLATVVDRLIVHVRDPRQSTLSWIHYLNTLHRNDSSVTAGYEESYFSMPLVDQITFELGHHFAHRVRWILDWLGARENSKLKILLTTYEDLLRDQSAFITRILDFYDIPAELMKPAVVDMDDFHVHYRVGAADEWMQIYSPAQKRWAETQMPDSIFETFRWPRE